MRTYPYLISLLILAASIIISITLGSVSIPLTTLAKLLISKIGGASSLDTAPQSFSTILFTLRLPRTVMVGLTGAALAGSGAVYQGLFRNPLAEPYLIGVASGAGLGAVIMMSFPLPYTTVGLFAVPVAAFVGALLTVFIVYQIARDTQGLQTTNLILAGVAVSSFATSLTSFLIINLQQRLRHSLVWLLGGSTMSGWQPVIAVLPLATLGLATLAASGHLLNVLQLGEEQAQTLGLPVKRVRFLIILAATLTTSAAVAFSGIIGFVGLIIPHTIRMIWVSDYRKLLPLAIINGASLLLVADVLARTVVAPQEIPVGIITALCGTPFFLLILRKAKQQKYW